MNPRDTSQKIISDYLYAQFQYGLQKVVDDEDKNGTALQLSKKLELIKFHPSNADLNFTCLLHKLLSISLLANENKILIDGSFVVCSLLEALAITESDTSLKNEINSIFIQVRNEYIKSIVNKIIDLSTMSTRNIAPDPAKERVRLMQLRHRIIELDDYLYHFKSLLTIDNEIISNLLLYKYYVTYMDACNFVKNKQEIIDEGERINKLFMDANTFHDTAIIENNIDEYKQLEMNILKNNKAKKNQDKPKIKTRLNLSATMRGYIKQFDLAITQIEKKQPTKQSIEHIISTIFSLMRDQSLKIQVINDDFIKNFFSPVYNKADKMLPHMNTKEKIYFYAYVIIAFSQKRGADFSVVRNAIRELAYLMHHDHTEGKEVRTLIKNALFDLTQSRRVLTS